MKVKIGTVCGLSTTEHEIHADSVLQSMKFMRALGIASNGANTLMVYALLIKNAFHA